MEKIAQFLQEIVCPSCAQQGHATWESSDHAGGLRRLATLSDGFSMAAALVGHDPVITCRKCGTVQIEQPSVGA